MNNISIHVTNAAGNDNCPRTGHNPINDPCHQTICPGLLKYSNHVFKVYGQHTAPMITDKMITKDNMPPPIIQT